MNIQNIVALATQLKGLGFDELGSLLLKRICFKPAEFSISSKLMKGNQQLCFELYFKKDKKTGDYILNFYDAILPKDTSLSNTEINGVDLAELENKMSLIDWKDSFDFDAKKQWSAEDKASWQTEASIAEIIDELQQLENTEEGKVIAATLKTKHCGVISNSVKIFSMSLGRNKQDVSQRFYLFEGQPGISINEAYRFLQNRWFEKQMRLKRKQLDEPVIKDYGSESKNDNGLLSKKRIVTKRKKVKKEN